MKKIFLFFFLFMAGLSLHSQVYFKNNYSEPVFVTIGWYSDSNGFEGWITSGWYKVEPGETKEVLGYNPMNQYIYYYAETANSTKKFEGSTSFLVHPSQPFRIKNADKKYVKDETPAYEWRKFRMVDKGMTDMLKLKYTIVFNY